jgi:hypothetical protein
MPNRSGAEQVALDHQRVEARHAPFRVDPMLDEMMLDRRAFVLHVTNLVLVLPSTDPASRQPCASVPRRLRAGSLVQRIGAAGCFLTRP